MNHSRHRLNRSLITGGTGLLGTALIKYFEHNNDCVTLYAPTSHELDLTDARKTREYISRFGVTHGSFHDTLDCVYHLAARVGGIKANIDYTEEFYRLNSYMGLNLLDACVCGGVPKVVSVMSTCVYPDASHVSYPLTEDQLHLGPPHSSNFGYAYSKRMLDVHTRAIRKQHGLEYVTVIPNNLFGENDNFHLEDSHVIPALIRKFWEAIANEKDVVEVWGDGTPLREFTYSRDVAKILTVVAEEYNDDMPLNVGNTNEVPISQVVDMISHFMGYKGKIAYNTNMPNGQHRKPSSNSRLLRMTSWKESDYTPFDEALYNTCEWFKINYPNVRGVDV